MYFCVVAGLHSLRLLLDYGVTLWVGNVLWFTVKAICELFGSKLQC